ncbi:MAG: CBS and ACT domain-containing protein [Chloroflexota bacterium]
MLVGERMSHPVITVSPDTSVHDAFNLMKKERINRLPVIHKGKLVGIVSDKDLLNASPSAATTLSVWEMNYLLSKITVKEVMSKEVRTVTEDTPIEEAARLMADTEVGGLPVVRNQDVVGIITENDLFKIMLELTGAREPGVRVTALIHEQPGQLAKIAQAISDAGGNFVAIGSFLGEGVSNRLLMFKISDLTLPAVERLIEPMAEKIVDIRQTQV